VQQDEFCWLNAAENKNAAPQIKRTSYFMALKGETKTQHQMVSYCVKLTEPVYVSLSIADGTRNKNIIDKNNSGLSLSSMFAIKKCCNKHFELWYRRWTLLIIYILISDQII
jgi:chloramphenicol O-acetyltransferase